MSARNAKSKAKPSTGQVVVLIEQARQRAHQAADSEPVGLYWRIGQYISAKPAAAVWGNGVVDRLAGERVTALLTQLPWMRDLIVLTKLGRPKSQTPDQCRPDFIGGNAAKRHSVLASLCLYAQCGHR